MCSSKVIIKMSSYLCSMDGVLVSSVVDGGRVGAYAGAENALVNAYAYGDAQKALLVKADEDAQKALVKAEKDAYADAYADADAQNALVKAEKDAQKAEKAAQKAAQKDAQKAEKDVQKALVKAEKDAEKALVKAEKDAEEGSSSDVVVAFACDDDDACQSLKEYDGSESPVADQKAGADVQKAGADVQKAGADVQKALVKAEKAAQKDTQKALVKAEKDAQKAEKDAQKALVKAEKAAQKALVKAQKGEKKTRRNKEDKKVEVNTSEDLFASLLSETETAMTNADELLEEEEEDIKVRKFDINGVGYLISDNNVLYDTTTSEEVGKWCEKSQTIQHMVDVEF